MNVYSWGFLPVITELKHYYDYRSFIPIGIQMNVDQDPSRSGPVLSPFDHCTSTTGILDKTNLQKYF